MNTDINPEDLNNVTDAHDSEEELFSYDPTDPIDAGTTAELPRALDLEDALAPEDDGDVSDAVQNPKRPTELKRKLVAGGVGRYCFKLFEVNFTRRYFLRRVKYIFRSETAAQHL